MQRLPISTTLFLMTYLCHQNNFATADIVAPPVSLNTTLNSTAVFTCAVDNAVTVYWMINNISTVLISDVDTEVVPMSDDSSVLFSTLLVPANVEYNRSSIVCSAVITNSVDPITDSNPVSLLIQGVLEPVSNLLVNTTNDSTISVVEWSPPYSLDNIPINYTVTVTGQLFGYSSSQVTSDLSHTVELPDLCDNYLLTVTASNGAGYSNNNTIVIYKLEGTHVLYDSVEVAVSIPSPGAKPEAVISFNVTHNCSIPLSHFINVSLNNDDNTPLSEYGPYHTNSTNQIITLTLTELTEDTLYHMTLWDTTTAGTISNPVPVNISSYDVQNVSISVDDDTGVLCVSCYFMVGSEAGGCVIELTADSDEDPDFLTVHLSRRSEESIVSGCIQSLVPGYYLLNIYDADEGGFKLPDATPALTRVGVPVMPHPLVTSSSSSSLYRTIETNTVVTHRISTSVETSPSVVNDRSSSFQAAEITYRNAAIGVGVVIIVVIMVLIALIIIQIRKLKQKRKRINAGIIPEDTNTVHFQAQISSDTAVTYASSTPSPPIETISPDEEAPPPPPPPSSSATLPQLRMVPSTTSDPSHQPRHSHTYSDNLPSPGAESTTSFTSLLHSESTTNGQRQTDSTRPRPSSYHEASVNAPLMVTDYSRRHDVQQGALNRTRGTSTLRPTGAMTAWAAVNPLTLPVLPEAPPPYDEIDRDSTSYQRPQSALLMSTNARRTVDDSTSSSVVSEQIPSITNPSSNLSIHRPLPHLSIDPISSMNPSSSTEYIGLDLAWSNSTSDTHLPSSSDGSGLGSVANRRSSNGSLYSGSVQYAIISNSNTFISSHDRLSSAGTVTNSLV